MRIGQQIETVKEHEIQAPGEVGYECVLGKVGMHRRRVEVVRTVQAATAFQVPTWNPVRGCTKITPDCDHCYAETFAERFRDVKGHPYEQGFDH